MVRTPRDTFDTSAAARRISRENRSTQLSGDDHRAVFAAHVSRQLDGGRAAILAPDKRRHLLKIARQLGLGDFDANLVIAIVQDAVREGDDPLVVSRDERLALIRPAAPEPTGARMLLAWWVGAMLLGAAILCGLIAWTMA